MPQLNQLPEIFWSQLFWLAVVFGTIFFGIGLGMLPKIRSTVDQRESKIGGDLAAAQAARAAADETEAAWRARMEVLNRYGTREQKEEWLKPLMEGEIRSAFLMTEPAVASSDATNIETRIEKDGDHYVINGRKWWSSGVGDPRCKIAILMGKTDPKAAKHQQQSQILVPLDTPGIKVERMVERFKAKTGATEVPPHCSMGFNQTWILLNNVLPVAKEKYGGFDPEAVRKAALDVDIPAGGTIQGYGVKFFPPGTPLSGQNERSTPVVMQNAGEHISVVWPTNIRTQDPVFPLPKGSTYGA